MKFTQSISELMIFTVVVISSLKNVVGDEEETFTHVDNGNIRLGINDDGCLNADRVGLQRWNEAEDDWAESTVYGHPAEGWAVWADGDFGRASEYTGPVYDQIDSFTYDEVSATSVVTIGMGKVKVTHYFFPSPRDPNLYEVDVILENVSGSTITDLRYRRALDWDTDPTKMNECVKIQPDPATVDYLYKATNNGFDELDFSSFWGIPAPFDFTEPNDHGAVFEFHFGSLLPGATREFQIFYGGTGNIPDADSALRNVGAEVYSYGVPKTSFGTCDFHNNVFIFAFAGVGGDPVIGEDSDVGVEEDSVIGEDSNVSETYPGGMGDPHFRTFAGEKYDFHGICDLVLLTNPGFNNETKMDIHIRTQRMKLWSFIASTAIRIGGDIFEVVGGKDKKFWINGILGTMQRGNFVGTISGYEIKFRQNSDVSHSFIVDLGEDGLIVFKVWNKFVSIEIQHPTKKQFVESAGLMGSFPLGSKVARDKRIEFNDINEFGQEWQVNGLDPNLFHEIEGPQFPEKCEIPSTIEMRRRLSQLSVTEKEAQIACSLVESDRKDLCIFDVLATSDLTVVGAY